MGPVIEEGALALAMEYVDRCRNHNVRLAFEALKVCFI